MSKVASLNRSQSDAPKPIDSRAQEDYDHLKIIEFPLRPQNGCGLGEAEPDSTEDAMVRRIAIAMVA